MIRINDAVRWVMEHRKNKAFIHQTRQQVGWAIDRAINANAFGYVIDAEGALLGLCCGTPDRENKTLWVSQILCIDRRALPALVERFHEQFNGYKILAKRRGKEVSYDTERLVQLLSK